MGPQEGKQTLKIPVVEIIRVSTLAQSGDDKAGIPAQKANCERIVKQHGLHVLQRFQIEGVSGAAVLRSPEMQHVVRIVASGQCRGIVLSEESRLMRADNYEDSGYILQLLKQNRVKLYLRDGVIDLNNASQKLYAGIKFEFADYERQIIRERTLGGKLAKRARGEWASGRTTVPYGLKLVRDGKRTLLAVDDETIWKVIDLFDLFVRGHSSFGELHRKTGIAYDRIRYILGNEIYTGWHSPRQTVDPRRNEYWKSGPKEGRLRYQRRKPIPEEERVRIKMLENPPISEEVFNNAQRLLSLKREMHWKKGHENAPDDPFVYRGLLRCAACGLNITTMRYRNNRKNFYAEYYVCQYVHGGAHRPDGTLRIKNTACKTRRMRREDVEGMLDELLLSRFGDENLLTNLIKAQEKMQNQESTKQKIERLQVDIARAERAIERNAELYGRGSITRAIFDKLQQKYELEKRASVAELEATTRPSLGLIDPEIWEDYAEQFKCWRRLEPHQKRKLLVSIAPVFDVVGTKGEKYHETVITVRGCRVKLTGKNVEMYTQAAAPNAQVAVKEREMEFVGYRTQKYL